MTDRHKNELAPPIRWPQITPSDDVELNPPPRALLPLADGTIVVEDLDGNVLALQATAYERLEYQPRKVRSTGTSPGLVIHGLY